MKGKRKTTGKVISKHYPLKAIRTWNFFFLRRLAEAIGGTGESDLLSEER